MAITGGIGLQGAVVARLLELADQVVMEASATTTNTFTGDITTLGKESSAVVIQSIGGGGGNGGMNIKEQSSTGSGSGGVSVGIVGSGGKGGQAVR